MRINHLNCATMRSLGGGRLLDGAPGLLRSAHLVCHVLLVEYDRGVVLVDTGFGAAAPLGMPRGFSRMARLDPDPTASALAQLRRLGYDRSDVRHIVLTHLDFDHAGGLRDFPEAMVHVHGPEYRAAMTPRSFLDRQRYRPALWSHGVDWRIHESEQGEPWFGFESVRGVPGLSDDLLLVPLPGHTHGHVGVAVRGEGGWLLHAGDAYFHRTRIDPALGPVPPAIRLFETLMQVDRNARVANGFRLRELISNHGDRISVFSSHDPAELARFSA